MLGRLIPLIVIFFYSFYAVIAQEEAMRVERCSAINPDVAVQNIYVDKDNNKWVSNDEGLWHVHAADLATPLILGSAESSLLQYPDGNGDIRWKKGEINDLLGGALSETNTITSGFYNEIQDQLWIGTAESGVFLFRTQPNLKWVKEINRRMPKFRSNHVNMIYVDAEDDRHFIGTDEGVIVGRDNNWGLEERYFRFQAVTNKGSEVWLLAEDIIWVVDKNDNWRTVEIDPEQIRGSIKDIAFDREGKLWVASEFLTVYDPENNKYKIFDGADYFTSNDVNCLAVDREGAVWVGTQDKGLFVIEKESAMTVTALLEDELSCDPAIDNASLIVKIKGGQPPYAYAWEGGLTGENPKNLGPGSYIVTVTDATGQVKPAEGVVPDTRLAVAVTQTKAHDESSRGAASTKIEGGKPKFTFLWDNGENGPTAERLEAGPHSVSITDANGCKTEGSVVITSKAGELALALEQTSKSGCAGESNNAIKANISGGISPYEYKWSAPAMDGDQVQNIAPGIYQLTVTDSRGASASASINIQALEGMTAKTMTIAQATPGNEDGRASVSVEGGSGKYKYAWDNGETKSSANKLAAGTHVVTVTDQNNCSAIAEVEITNEIGELAVSIEAVSKSVCAGDGANSAKTIIRGGEGPYQIKWSQDGLEGEEVKNLEPGVHYVTVTDQRGANASASINFESLQPLEVEASVHAAATANNKDGRASVKVSGGTGTYTYAWSNGETTSAANTLAPGKHTVTVSDEAKCTASAEVEITENISEMALVVNQTANIKCNGDQTGAIEAVISGGKGPFEFVWNDGSLQGERSDGLYAGNFAATVTDAAGNTASASIILEEPTALEAEIVEQRGVTDEASKDGKAQIIVSGGTAPYTYKWDTQHTGDKVENLSIGDHTVTVTDANECELIITFETEQKILPQLSLNKLKNGQVVQMQMLQFEADSTNVNIDAEPILNEVYTFLKDNPGIVIRVAGHTNNTPSDEYCDRISTARAKSVAEYIVQKGVAGERVYFRGYGKREPMYSNLTPTGRAKNQRVEIQILEVGEGS